MPPHKKRASTGAKKHLTNIIEITRKGVGYVPWPSKPDNEDIEVKTEDLGGALNGDMVEVELVGFSSRPKASPVAGLRPRGKVVRVVERAKSEFVGTLKKKGNEWVTIPADVKFYRPIHIVRPTRSNKDSDNLKEGTKVLVKLLSFTGVQDPEGEIIEVIGTAGEHRTEMNAIVLEHGFTTRFPDAAIKEAEDIEKNHARMIAQEVSKRADFRDITTFTIDPVDAKDYDDALSIQTLPNGEYEIGIHIADVSFFVREGTAIDEEAQKRGTSVYLVDATIPMLPHELSGNVCSLKEGEDRLAFAAVVRMSAKGEVLDRRFERTIIRSHKRFTYEEAQCVLDTGIGPYAKELADLWRLAQILKKGREREGAIDFGDNEVRFELDEQGKPLKVIRKQRIDTNMLIEEFMLLANREVAHYISALAQKVPEKNLVFLYRIHDEPKADRIEELATFVRAVGYEFGKKIEKPARTEGVSARSGGYTARDISRLLEQIEGKPEASLIRTATLRSMAKAIYSTKNIGHFGLAFEYYTHFTSPIRRYPDLLVHRIVESHLSGTPLTRREYSHLETLCIKASEQEARAVNAERDSIRYKLVEYMQDKVGQTFEGTVSGVTEWGLYVEEVQSSAEGLVRVRTLGDDFYNYSQKEYALIGQRTKKKYTLGDSVRIKLIAADLITRQLDFELVR